MKMTLLAKAVTVTSGSVMSNDVDKVRYDYYASSANQPASIFLTEERWFARGIGLIYNSFDNGTTKVIYNIGFYK